MPFASNGAVQLFYEQHGSGTPVVFVHEFSGDARSWALQINQMARRHRCVAFNARGYPPSSVPEADTDYGHQHAVADIATVLDAAKIESAHLVGLSMGAYSTMCFALRHPERARSVVLAGIGTGSDPDARAAFLEDSARTAERLEQLGMSEGIARFSSNLGRLPLKEKDPLGFAVFMQQFSEHSARGSARTLRGYQCTRPPLYAWEAELKQMQVPALVMVGDRDAPCLRPSFFLRNRLPNVRLAVLPNSGHGLNLEEPVLFNHLVGEFIADIERARGVSAT